MKRMKVLLSLLLVIGLIAATLVTFGSCGKKNPAPADSTTDPVGNTTDPVESTADPVETTADKKTVTLIVVDKEGEKTTYTIATSAEFLRGAFADAEGLTVEGDETGYGLYIKTVNGLRGDYTEDGYFWSLCDKDGNMTPNGADSTAIADGDVYQLIYTKA